MVGAYLAVALASQSLPKTLWSENPVTISFSGIGASSLGSIGDSFKCAPDTPSVSLETSVSNPTRINLTTDFAPDGPCGPQFNNITITAHCLVPAPRCSGTYTGSVTVVKAYSFFPPSLSVNIVVS
jgi:hypothetical protein